MRQKLPSSSLCAVCQMPLTRGILMCVTHWKMAPQLKQNAVHKTFVEVQRGKDAAHLQAALRRKYSKACDAAIAAVNLRLNGAANTPKGDDHAKHE